MITQLEFTLSKRGSSQNELLRAYLLARPGRWLPMVELGQAIGAWHVNSRVSDLRKLFGMAIEQRHTIEPGTRKKLSEYRYQPN